MSATIDRSRPGTSSRRRTGYRDSVIKHHEALHEATRQDFLEAVENIVGEPVTAYLTQVHPSTGYAVRVFVFSSEMPAEEVE